MKAFRTRSQMLDHADLADLGGDLHRLRGACAVMCVPAVVAAIRQVEASLVPDGEAQRGQRLAELEVLLCELEAVLVTAVPPDL